MQAASSRLVPPINHVPPDGGHRPKWMQYGGFYRPICDTSKAWVPSPYAHSPMPVPNAPLFALDLKVMSGEVSSLDSHVSSSTSASGTIHFLGQVTLIPTIENRARDQRKPSRIQRLARKLKLGTASKSKKKTRMTHPLDDSPRATLRVQPHEWKEWGYYARPLINGVQVHNTSSPPENYGLEYIDAASLTPEEVMQSLSSPNGTSHPERWKLGISHPSLPPRPSRWEPPDPHQPLPFPWEVQLNPFLEHILFGVPRMYWDVREDISAAQYGLTTEEDANACSRPLSAADLSQPATWPFLTHMYVNALADDISPKFAWPFMVLNPSGIKVRDIVNSVHHNFREYVRSEEYYGWTVARRRGAAKAHRKRCDPVENPFKAMYGEVEEDDDMRRIDYLGGRTLFRGLAPNPDASGWVLYLGQD